MGLYLSATAVPRDAWTIVAATNLEGAAALWLQSQASAEELHYAHWDDFIQGLRSAFLPKDTQ